MSPQPNKQADFDLGRRRKGKLKYALAAGFAVLLGLAGATTGYGQAAIQSTPTTKLLAIGTINPGVEREKVLAMLPEEVRDTTNLYLQDRSMVLAAERQGGGVHLERH
jgi:hypothetical protein